MIFGRSIFCYEIYTNQDFRKQICNQFSYDNSYYGLKLNDFIY